MAKEGKNDRFARRVCESLKPHLEPTTEHIPAPVHALRNRTALGHEDIIVHLWGANAPCRHLEFTVGVCHDQFENARLRLGLDPTVDGSLHFWQNTGNFRAGWPELGDADGRWDANLDEDPATLASQLVPYLHEVVRKVLAQCSDLRTVRNMVELGANGPLFIMDPWEKTVLIDVALQDWDHLADYVRRAKRPYIVDSHLKLTRGLEKEFGIKLPA